MSDQPAPPKKPRVNMARAWAEARALIWKHRRSLSVGLALMLVNRLAGLVLPASSKYLIDDVLGKQQVGLLVPLALAVGGATVIQAITSFALSQTVSIAAQRAISDMRIEIQRHVLRLPVSFFDSTKSGVLITRVMSDADGIRNLIGTGLVQLTGGVITAAIALGVLFYLNWRLTASTIFVLLAFGGMMAVAFKRLRPLFRRRNEINAEVTGRLGEALGGIRTVKVYTAEAREERIFAEGIERLFRNIASTITGTSAVGAATTVIVGVIGVLMIIIGGRSIVGGTMTLGDFVMYIFFIGLVAAPLVQIASIGTQVSEAFAGLDRIREIRGTSTEDQEDERRAAIGELRGDVAFEHVSFEYAPGVPVLRDISFTTKAGTTTALVGSSGAGKSTLIGLVSAFNRPTSGRVLVDGRDAATLRLRDYRANLGVVMQDNFLFDGTIRENIAFAKPDATDEEIRAVSRIAHCDEFIERFEAKYDTIVGERGVKLSGGQRQRVAIARAILADPRILILDEATSSLDSESEALIRDGLRSLRRGRTTFVIAHRLSTIESADQILVMEEGRILERGTHAELLAANGRYRQLYDKQYRIEHDQFINPGEDFLPVPEPGDSAVPVPRPARGAL
ncbi:MAG: putative multidrug export ATP-binding/permease protein [Geminicoccaceae bacterium]|jgi:subfamily B ATP-binding cassette protein MsbA|nr:putative multidrug export ATP-binding/permease protein [Geminicoccaceae bacterium]